MSGDADDVKHAPTQVDSAGLLGPVRNAESLLHRLHSGRNQRGIWHPGEAFVPRDVIAMAVRMRYYQRDRGALLALEPLADQPLHHHGGIALARPGIHQQRAVMPEK